MIIFLPPSEGKTHGGHPNGPSLSRTTDLPLEIATSTSEKDLKCTGNRYEEGITLNRSISQGPWMSAIDRYDGVMYRAIDYPGLSDQGKVFFNNHVRILSGLYGMVSPQDQIANYKLPIHTRLKHFWKNTLTDYINTIESELIIDLLPGSYRSMIDRKNINAHVTTVERHQENGKKIAHRVKGIKGRRLHDLCNSDGGEHDWTQDKIIFGP